MSTSLVTPESAVDCATTSSGAVSPNSLIRPKLLAFETTPDSGTSMQNQQILLKNVHAKSPSVSPSPTSPSAFLAEMPQWKKDLIQRRKTNVARNSILAADTLTSSTTNDDHEHDDNDLVEGVVAAEDNGGQVDVAGEFVL